MSSPPPGTQSGLAEPFNTLYKILIEPAQERFAELSMFSPAIFTLGSLFVSFITLNYPIFLFSIASGEALLIQNGLRGVSSYLNTVESVQEARTLGKSEKCKSRYEGSESTKFKYLLDNGISVTFPNAALYFVSFASAYCIQSMLLFTQECADRGSSYSIRPYLGAGSACMCIILLSLFVLLNSCDSPLGVILSVVAGLLVGFTLCYQNFLLFGKPGVDMLFIPPLVSRSGMDYICVSTN